MKADSRPPGGTSQGPRKEASSSRHGSNWKAGPGGAHDRPEPAQTGTGGCGRPVGRTGCRSPGPGGGGHARPELRAQEPIRAAELPPPPASREQGQVRECHGCCPRPVASAPCAWGSVGWTRHGPPLAPERAGVRPGARAASLSLQPAARGVGQVPGRGGPQSANERTEPGETKRPPRPSPRSSRGSSPGVRKHTRARAEGTLLWVPRSVARSGLCAHTVTMRLPLPFTEGEAEAEGMAGCTQGPGCLARAGSGWHPHGSGEDLGTSEWGNLAT